MELTYYGCVYLKPKLVAALIDDQSYVWIIITIDILTKPLHQTAYVPFAGLLNII